MTTDNTSHSCGSMRCAGRHKSSTPADICSCDDLYIRSLIIPVDTTSVIKRILRGASSPAADRLIRDVRQRPLSTSIWSKLVGFSSAAWRRRSEVANQKSLTTQIVKQLYQYDQGVEELPPSEPPAHLCPPRRTDPPKRKTHAKAIALLASVKLDDGDVKGAVCQLRCAPMTAVCTLQLLRIVGRSLLRFNQVSP